MRLGMRSENKNTCSWLPRKESVYKKMSLSLDYPCLQRATVCYSGLIWPCLWLCGNLPHVPYSGPFNYLLWWRKESVEQSRKIVLKVLVSWANFLVGANFWERHAKTVPLCLFFGLFSVYFDSILSSKSRLVPILTPFATVLWRGPPVLWWHELWIGQVMRCYWLI